MHLNSRASLLSRLSIVGPFLILLTLQAFFFGPLQRFDRPALDLWFCLRNGYLESPTEDPYLVMAFIDDTGRAEYGGDLLSAANIASVVNLLAQTGARATLTDILRPKLSASDEAILSDAFRRNGRVALPILRDGSGAGFSYPESVRKAAAGEGNIVRGSGELHAQRRAYALDSAGFPSLAREALRIAGIASYQDGEILLDFPGRVRDWKAQYRFEDLLTYSRDVGAMPPELRLILKDAIVLIADVSSWSGDFVETPFEPTLSSSYIHLVELNSRLAERPLRESSLIAQELIVLVCGALFFFLPDLRPFHAIWAGFLGIALFLGISFASFAFFRRYFLTLPLLVCFFLSLAINAIRLFAEVRQEKRLLDYHILKMRMFADFSLDAAAILHSIQGLANTGAGLDALVAANPAKADEINDMRNRAFREILETAARGLQNLKHSRSVDPQPVDLRAAMGDAEARLRHKYPDAIVTLDSDAGEFLVEAIPFEMVLLLENLLSNGIESYPADRGERAIGVSLRKKDRTIVLEARDGGCGIPLCFSCSKKNCLRCKIMEMGYTTKKTGSGYGLSHVQDVLLRYGARLRFQSSALGTTVRVTFPASR